MHQKFTSFQESESLAENDKRIIVSANIVSENSNISAKFERTTKTEQPSGNFRTILEESIAIEKLSADDLGVIWSLISDWEGSRSRPAISDSIDEITGEYERSEKSSGYRRPHQDESIQFESVNIALGTAGLAFIIPNGDNQTRFNIPASEVPGRKPEYTNISTFSGFIFDFFDIEYEGNIEDIQLELPPQIESIERLDEELQRRAVSEFESCHFQSSVRTAFTVLEERVRELGEYSETEYGASLIQNAFHPSDGKLAFGESSGERDGVMFLYRGAFQALRNPASHRFIESVDEDYARDAILTVNLLLRLLEENNSSQPSHSS